MFPDQTVSDVPGPYREEIATIRERDLARLSPSRINDDLQLLAAVLVPTPVFAIDGDDWDTEIKDTFARTSENALAHLKNAIDKHYADTLEFPRNQEELQSILGDQYTAARDPWMDAWYSEFATEGSDYVRRIASAGPDKKRGTADDFVALEVRRDWFTPYRALMAQQLKELTDYPATDDAFKTIVRRAGINFDELHDPWGSGLRVIIDHEQQRRVIRILSAGPDAGGTPPMISCWASFPVFIFARRGATLGRRSLLNRGFRKMLPMCVHV